MDTKQIAIFGGGCFWCTETVFGMLKGVLAVESGYTGGPSTNPSYEEVSSGDSGHAEVVRITFDPTVVKYQNLLDVFFTTHDPTTLNRQGNDVGAQYRSAIFYTDDFQKAEAIRTIDNLNSQNVFDHKIVTSLEPFKHFYPAEEYHQNFYNKNPQYPYCTAVINPKVTKLRQKYAHLLKG
jgi:peptide-methionine (S)-S-oxide reductase